MSILNIKKLPEDIYEQLNYLAKKDHRSLEQQTIILLKEGLECRMGSKDRRKKLLEEISLSGETGADLPDPVTLIREDREGR